MHNNTDPAPVLALLQQLLPLCAKLPADQPVLSAETIGLFVALWKVKREEVHRDMVDAPRRLVSVFLFT